MNKNTFKVELELDVSFFYLVQKLLYPSTHTHTHRQMQSCHSTDTENEVCVCKVKTHKRGEVWLKNTATDEWRLTRVQSQVSLYNSPQLFPKLKHQPSTSYSHHDAVVKWGQGGVWEQGCYLCGAGRFGDRGGGKPPINIHIGTSCLCSDEMAWFNSLSDSLGLKGARNITAQKFYILLWSVRIEEKCHCFLLLSLALDKIIWVFLRA